MIEAETFNKQGFTRLDDKNENMSIKKFLVDLKETFKKLGTSKKRIYSWLQYVFTIVFFVSAFLLLTKFLSSHTAPEKLWMKLKTYIRTQVKIQPLIPH